MAETDALLASAQRSLFSGTEGQILLESGKPPKPSRRCARR
jgi:hypothetical protein